MTDPGYPGRLALQYWMFYVYNDWNNLHEGDWEMIQLNFDAASAAQALRDTPVEVGYSQHTGGERAAWGDDKLEIVGGTHPVVYPASGSHAGFFDQALYLGASGSQGVGCDDTRDAGLVIHPAVVTIPSDRAAAVGAFPWIAFKGRWGELQPAFFNGPQGPNLKTQWTKPIQWSQEWRDRSYAVPTGGALGTRATDFFCGTIERGSVLLWHLVDDPFPTVAAFLAALAIAAILLSRATWRPVAPLRLARRRTWGQVITSARPDVHEPLAAVPRHRCAVPADLPAHHRSPGGRPRRVEHRRHRGRGPGRGGVRAGHGRDRYRPHRARDHAGAGGDGPRIARDRRGPRGRARSGPTGWRPSTWRGCSARS